MAKIQQKFWSMISFILFKKLIMQKTNSKPWNTNVGLDDPGQMNSLTLNYVSGGRRAFNSSVASFFV